jgi:rare lipoprotein A
MTTIMQNKLFLFVNSLIIAAVMLAFTGVCAQQKGKNNTKPLSTVKKTDKTVIASKTDSINIPLKNTAVTVADTTKKIQEKLVLSVHKKHAHASYYHNKFNGKRTASGEVFDNNKYTAAHKKLPFGTMLKVTNEANGKFVIVKVNDRGPFTKTRDIDLSRKAFMELADNKNSGSVSVTIEIIEN